MAHFIGYVQGRSKTQASRLGTKATGLTARAQGWNIGGLVRMYHDSEGRDCVTFELTGGSNKNGSVLEQAATQSCTFVLRADGIVEKHGPFFGGE